MYRKVTSDHENKGNEEVRGRVLNARSAFLNALNHLRNKKQEHAEIKRGRELEKKQREEDERTAQMFKFTKMKKKEPFLPCVKLRGFFEREQALVPLHGPNMDHRVREALIFPDRVK